MPKTDESPVARTERIMVRISPAIRAQVEDLARLWGGVRKLSIGQVVEEAIARAYRAERGGTPGG